MVNRFLSLLLVIVAVLAIGWTAAVLLWDPVPQISVAGNATPTVATTETGIHVPEELTASTTPARGTEIPQKQNRGSPPVMDASMGIDELYRVVSTLGIEPADFRTRMQEFYCGAGWPPAHDQYSLSGCNLEQPYLQYDNETLQQLAQNGDMWAQQIFAERIETTRPAEAIQWYQRAAAQGSASAAVNIAAIYNSARTDFLNNANLTDTNLLEQTLALHDSTESPRYRAAAWIGVSNLMARRSLSSDSLGEFGASLGSEQFAEACGMAEQLLDQFEQDARDAGREPPPRRVSPLLIRASAGDPEYCAGPGWSDPETENCLSFTVNLENVPGMPGPQQLPGWICTN